MVESSTDTPAALPARLRWVWWAVGAWCAFTVLAAIELFAAHDDIYASLIKANAKATKPKADYTGSVVDHDIHNFLLFGFVQSILICAILIFLTRVAVQRRNWARWTLIGLATIIPVVLGLRIGVVVQLLLLGFGTGLPWFVRITEVLAGASSVGVVAILLLPEVRAYFSSGRDGGALSRFGFGGAGLGGGGGMFGPRRRPVAAAPGGDAGAARLLRPPASASSSASAGPDRPLAKGGVAKGGVVKGSGVAGDGVAGDVPTSATTAPAAVARGFRRRGAAPKSREQ